MPTYDPSKDPIRPSNPYAHTEEGVATVSPTGAPVLPPKAVPWAVGLVGMAAVGLQTLPPHTVAYQVCSVVVSLGAVLGLISPGLRRK